MRKQTEAILSIILLIILTALFPTKLAHQEIQQPIREEVLSIQPQPVKTEEAKLLEKMSLEEKVGQLFIFGFEGTTLTEEIKGVIKEKDIGGIILYKRNISNEKQTKTLISDLQSQSTYPLIVSIDQEGGIVTRVMGSEILEISQPEIQTEKQAYDIAYQRGLILKDLGFNMNHSPVIEYVTDKKSFLYNRVFRGSKESISKLGSAMIGGYDDAGIISTPKHYPGHSNNSPDSHKQLPVVDITNSQWDEYIYPFKYVIENSNVEAIMVGHIKYPNIDSKPSTISKDIITERLKNDLEFQGVIISDDMEMDSIESIGDHTTIAKEALLAGIDILLYQKNREIQDTVYNYILTEVKNGNITEEIIDEKVLRILDMKLNHFNWSGF